MNISLYNQCRILPLIVEENDLDQIDFIRLNQTKNSIKGKEKKMLMIRYQFLIGSMEGRELKRKYSSDY